MNKKLNIAIATLFLATASIAATEEDSKYYVGIGGTTDSGGKFSGEVSGVDSGTISYDSKTKSKIAKLGMFLENGDRVELSYQSGEFTLDQVPPTKDSKTIKINYKMFFEEPKVGSFTPYGVVGIGKHELNTSTSTTLKGKQWGAGVGGVYGIDNDLELEISAQRIEINYDAIYGDGITVDYSNTSNELYLGVNYKL